MRSGSRPLQIIRNEIGPFLVLNAVAFGLFSVGFVLGLVFPDLVRARLDDFEASGQTDLVLEVFQDPWLFALVISAVNAFTVGAAMIVLPSMVVPFLGISVFAWKPVNIGLAVAPTTPTLVHVLL